jgi:DNA-directed RNA polymerase subunit RPC12/RpoP
MVANAVENPTVTRSSTDVCEIYACADCGAKRVWGHATTRTGVFPPEPTPALRCERCGTTRRHGFVESRALDVTATLGWWGEAGATEARVVGVKWRGRDGEEI